MSNPPRKAFQRTPRRPRPAVAVFARGVSPGRVKTRLIPLLGPRGAAEFHAALVSDTVRKVSALSHSASRYFFLAGGEYPPSLSGYRQARQRGANLGERLERAFWKLFRRHRVVVVIGTDSPALRPLVIQQAFRELQFCDAVLGPAPDGGYYLIGLSRREHKEMRGIFRGVRWGSALAFRDTLECFLRRGLICSILEPCADVDRPEDFRKLERSLARHGAARRAAPAVWRFAKQFRRKSSRAPHRGRAATASRIVGVKPVLIP